MDNPFQSYIKVNKKFLISKVNNQINDIKKYNVKWMNYKFDRDYYSELKFNQDQYNKKKTTIWYKLFGNKTDPEWLEWTRSDLLTHYNLCISHTVRDKTKEEYLDLLYNACHTKRAKFPGDYWMSPYLRSWKIKYMYEDDFDRLHRLLQMINNSADDFIYLCTKDNQLLEDDFTWTE